MVIVAVRVFRGVNFRSEWCLDSRRKISVYVSRIFCVILKSFFREQEEVGGQSSFFSSCGPCWTDKADDRIVL